MFFVKPIDKGGGRCYNRNVKKENKYEKRFTIF